MPNHVQNKLTIKGNNIDKIRVAIKNDENNADIDFNNIIPIPESLMIECHTGVLNAAKNALKMSVHENELIGMLESENRNKQGSPLEFEEEDWEHFIQCLENKREHGYLYWYEWRTDNWGTKWNAYGQPDDRTDKNTIYFETAWSMPEPIIEKLSEKYPSNTFCIEWANEDTGSDVGRRDYINGKVVDKYEPENRTKEAFEMCFELMPYRKEHYELVDGNYEYVEEEI